MLSERLFVIGSCPVHGRVVSASLDDAQILIYDNQNCPLSFPNAVDWVGIETGHGSANQHPMPGAAGRPMRKQSQSPICRLQDTCRSERILLRVVLFKSFLARSMSTY